MAREAEVAPELIERMRSDAYARFLGATVEAVAPGYARVSLTVHESLLNFHGITHGGVVFGLADIAFGAASNSHGNKALALSASVNFLRATQAGDQLVAEAREVSQSGPTACYDITVSEARSGELVAKCQGMVYRKREPIITPESNAP